MLILRYSFAIVSLFLVSAESLHAEKRISREIQAVISAPPYHRAHWGILVTDQKSGKSVYQINAGKLFIPASTTKLFSVAAALDELGADFRFETPVYWRGKLDKNGQLDGDLILVASGDFTLGGRTLPDGEIAFANADHICANLFPGELTKPDPLAGLDDLARQVANSGIKEILGEIVIDDRLFDHAEATGCGPRQVTPIRVNDNLIDITVTPTTIGHAAKVEWRPKSTAWRIDAFVKTVAGNVESKIDVARSGQGRLTVRGQIAVKHRPVLRVHEVDNPASFARSLFIESLRRAGVRVSASPLSANPHDKLPSRDDYENLSRAALLISPPFSEAARLILKVSHNLHACTLPQLIAVRHGKRTLSDGLQLQRKFLLRAGVDADSISFGSSAGGSFADYTTPRATVALLRYMATRDDFAVYHRALPILGVDGTLAGVVGPDSPAHGKVHAKTGTLFWYNTMNDRYILTSKALAGYMTTAGGRPLIFSLVVNNVHLDKLSDAGSVGATLGRLCEIIYNSQ